jgi:hypothetical protein
MWVHEQICGWVIERRTWSPVCSALIAALLFEPELARAAEAEPPPAPAPGVAMPLEPMVEASGGILPATHASPIAPMPVSAMAGEHFGAEAALPVRLDAHAVLGLREMFPFDDHPWRAPFPSADAIRTLDLIDTRPAQLLGDESSLPDPLANPVAGPTPTWFDQHIELTFKDGVAYKKNFAWRGMNLRLKIWGPVVKGDPGLGFRLRGLKYHGYGVDLRSRITTEFQDLQVDIAF